MKLPTIEEWRAVALAFADVHYERRPDGVVLVLDESGLEEAGRAYRMLVRRENAAGHPRDLVALDHLLRNILGDAPLEAARPKV
jgi:hypothetical protein